MMSEDKNQSPDPRIVEKLVENARQDAEIEVAEQRIDLQISELSAQWVEAEKQGDERRGEALKAQMKELIKARSRIGA
jgi:hypothetical protein